MMAAVQLPWAKKADAIHLSEFIKHRDNITFIPTEFGICHQLSHTIDGVNAVRGFVINVPSARILPIRILKAPRFAPDIPDTIATAMVLDDTISVEIQSVFYDLSCRYIYSHPSIMPEYELQIRACSSIEEAKMTILGDLYKSMCSPMIPRSVKIFIGYEKEEKWPTLNVSVGGVDIFNEQTVMNNEVRNSHFSEPKNIFDFINDYSVKCDGETITPLIHCNNVQIYFIGLVVTQKTWSFKLRLLSIDLPINEGTEVLYNKYSI